MRPGGPGYGQGCYNSPYDFTGGSNTSQPTIRHGVGTNFLLADGHAKFLKPAQVSVGVANTNNTYQNGPNAGYQAASPNAMFLDDGKTPVAATFSPS